MPFETGAISLRDTLNRFLFTSLTVPSQYSENDYGVDTGYDWWAVELSTGSCQILDLNLTNGFIIDADSNRLG